MKTKEEWLESEQWHEIGDTDVLRLIDKVQQDALSSRTPTPELVELRKDKERLDWLTGLSRNKIECFNTEEGYWLIGSSDSKDIREAIDGAMKKQ